MNRFSDPEERDRYRSLLDIHLKNGERDLPAPEQIKALQKRDRNKWLQFGVNLLAMVLFGYSFLYDITQLGYTFFLIITAVFAINVVLIFYQKRQIAELITYLERSRENGAD